MSGKIGIVTVLYKSESVLPEFFESIEKQTYKNFILYIIDNKSPDNSLALSEKFKIISSFETVVIANDDNYGVAKGNNIGIKQALVDDCDYILLSNNDVTFEKNTVWDLLENLVSTNADMAVPKIYYRDTKLIWFAEGKFLKFNGQNIHVGYLENDNGKFDKKKIIETAPTCFMLIQKDVFKCIGLMDEKYFVYWDDTDFIYRSKKIGKTLWYFPKVTINHWEGTSTGVKSDFSIYYLFRNFVYFTLKNRNFIYAIYVLCINCLFHLTNNLVRWKFSRWKIGFYAYIDGFKLFMNKDNFL
ncbi:MAG: glycosyltransferase family 2 protein [Paludibacter sp.]